MMKTAKKIICIMITLLMIISLFPVSAIATQAVQSSDDTELASPNSSATSADINAVELLDSVPSDVIIKEGLTRAEWMKDLVVLFELNVEKEEYPDIYFPDISESTDFYDEIMTAVYHGVASIEAGDEFKPDTVVTREFAAQTMNHCLGIQKNSDTYLFSDADSVTFKDDAQVSLEQGWITLNNGKFLPQKEIESDEIVAMVNSAQKLLDARSIDDNVSDIVLASSVIVVPDSAEVTSNLDYEKNIVTVSISNWDGTIRKGDTFAFYSEGFPFVYSADKVTKENGTLIIVTKEAPDGAIVGGEYAGVQELEIKPDLRNNEPVTLMSDDGEEIHFDRIKLQSSSNRKITFSRSFEFGSGIHGSITGTVKNVKLESKFNVGQQYFKLSGEMTVNSTAELDLLDDPAAASLPLGGVTLGEFGYAGLEIDLTMNAKIGYEFDTEFNIGVERAFGSWDIPLSFNTKDSCISAEGGFSAKLALAAHLTFGKYGKAYAGVGVGPKLTASMKKYYSGKPECCVTLAGYLYAGAEVNATLSPPVGSALSYSDSWDYYDMYNSPMRVYTHTEDGVQVLSCTRANDPGETYYGYINPRYITPASSRYYGGGSKVGADVPIWTIEEIDGIVTITSYSGNASILNIPETIDGKTVTAIGSNVFSGKTFLKTVFIPDTITAIGAYAFQNCSNLKSVDFGKNLKRIDTCAFQGTALEEVYLPEGFEKMGTQSGWYNGRTFRSCHNLKKVYIPATITTAESFWDKSYGNFSDCPSLDEVEFGKGITSIPNKLFRECDGLTSIEIPDTVVSIGAGAFSSCENLTAVKLSESVTEIMDSAFSSTAIEEIYLPEGLTTLGSSSGNVFANCDQLKKVYIPSTLEKVYHIYGGYENESYLGNFGKCPNLKTIEFGEGIPVIPPNLFFNCRGLENIVIPDTVTKIGASAFQGCMNLSAIKLSDNLTEIESSAFRNTGLEEVKLPEGLTTIGSKTGNTFADCDSLKKVYIPSTLKKVAHIDGGFDNVNYLGNFAKCPNLKTIEFGAGITEIPAWLFFQCKGLESIEIPDSVTSIGSHAFAGSGLKTVTIPETVESYGNRMFQNCTSLTSANLNESNTNIPEYMFEGCTSLTEIDLPENTTLLKEGTYKDCTSLKKVDLPDLIQSIGKLCFSGCTDLESFKASNDLISIGNNCFQGDVKLTQVDLIDGLQSLGEYAFQGCVALETIVLPDSVTSLGKYVFQKDTALNSVMLSKGLTELPSYAFANCSSKQFTSIQIPNGVKTIKDHAFYQDAFLKTFTIPASVTSIGDEAFSYAPTTTVNGVSGSYAETYAKWKAFNDISKNVESISLSSGKGEITIAKGKTIKPLFSFSPEDSTDVVTLTSDNTKAVSVSNGNMLSGKAVGTANITATTTSGQTITFPVKVANISSIEIAEKPAQLNYAVKEDKNLKGIVVNAVFSNGDTEQINDYTVSGFTTDSKGVKTVTVSYADKTATFKINVGEKDVSLVAHTISLEGNIGINYYFSLSDKVLNDSGAKVVFSMPNDKTTEILVSEGSKRAYGDGYIYGYSCDVTSTQMTGKVTAQVILSDGTESELFPYTVKEYADKIIENKNNSVAFTKATPMVKAMLNYGAYAQQFFQYDDSVLANVDLKAEEKNVSGVTAEDLVKFASIKNGLQKGLVFQGSTLVLKSETSIRHYFTVESGYSINNFTFQCDGKRLTPVASGNMYYVEIPNIASGDLDTMYEVKVGDFSIKYGALSYAYNQLVKTNNATELNDLCRAMYLYNQEANAYFKK